MNTKLYLLLFFLIFQCAYAQAQRFQAGGVFGVNFSELQGGEVSGQVGLNLGLLAKAKLNDRCYLSTEILYSQAGDYILPVFYPPADYGKIRLNYLEIPVYLSALAYQKDNCFQKHFSLGVSYLQLLSHRIETKSEINLSEQIIWERKNTLVGHLGVAHYFNSNLGLGFRASLAKNQIYWAWTLTLRMIYII